MSTTLSIPSESHRTADAESRRHRRQKGWLAALLLRLHFYAGILVAPFILIAASSGALYAIAPSLEQIVYKHELRVPISSTQLSLADQIDAARNYVGGDESNTLSAVRPAPEPGDTTRVMFQVDGLGESESRAVFVDPGSGEIRGDMTVYGTSGALPLRTWIDHLHRNLHLGDVGRLYSELAASWLGIVALAGLVLWVVRLRKTRGKREMVFVNLKRTGYRRVFSMHASLGVWVLLGALFLSATGITWSQYAGANVSQLRSMLDWGTPSVTTDLSGDEAPADEHAEHHGAHRHDASTGAANPATFDAVLAIAQRINVNTGLVEIRPPASPGTAWVVQEIHRSYPTEVDAVAVDGTTMEVVDRVDFADFPLAAKLSRWGIDIHMGSMFGLANQIVLFLVAVGIGTMVVLGYLMWWKRRPTREPRRLLGAPPRRGVLRGAPWWGILVVMVAAVLIGTMFPLVGYTLLGFVVIDIVLGVLRSRA